MLDLTSKFGRQQFTKHDFSKAKLAAFYNSGMKISLIKVFENCLSEAKSKLGAKMKSKSFLPSLNKLTIKFIFDFKFNFEG
jgi:hypothetical protein